MAVVALIVGGDEQIRALPGRVTDVERSCGSGFLTPGQSLAADNNNNSNGTDDGGRNEEGFSAQWSQCALRHG